MYITLSYKKLKELPYKNIDTRVFLAMLLVVAKIGKVLNKGMYYSDTILPNF